MEKYIQLYLDTDFIIPIGVGESGNFQKYADSHASRRFWLYFNKAANDMYESSESSKLNFEAGRDGYYGDFWNHIANGDKVSGTSYPYIELLDLARIITQLREWSNMVLFTETPEVVLNFSTVIPVKARRAFADYIEQKLGKVRSYSVEMNDLLSAKIQYDYQTLDPSFGDQLLIIQGAGRDVLLSVQTWCGGLFMQGDDEVRLAQKGSDSLKYALAKIVVDRYEQYYNVLLPAQKEQEYIYQTQFAGEWLKERNKGDSIWIEGFHYSNNPGRIYTPIEIDCKQLDLKEKDAIRSTTNDISKFYKESIVNRHLHTIFLGDVFKEGVLLKDCVSVTSSDGKYTYFNDNAIQEALGRYYVKHSTLIEDLKELERKFMDKSNERSRIRAYVKNAQTLASLRDKVKCAVNSISEVIADVERRNEDLKSSWESYMRRSDFNQAFEITKQISTNDSLFVARAEGVEAQKAVEQYNSLLIELKELDDKDVSEIVNDILSTKEKLVGLVENANKLNSLQEYLKETTQKYKDCYGRYQELKRMFDNEVTLAGRRKIVEEMKDITMEDLPVLDTAPISGTLNVKSTKTGGVLGFGAKKMISVSLTIDNPLPCKGVLIISPTPISSMPEGRFGVHCIDVEKGSEGEVVNITEDISTFNLGKSPKSIFVKFWPHENEKIPINRFEIKGGGLTTI